MTGAEPFLSAWHEVTLTDARDVTDGIVHPDHRGPSPALAAFLRGWPGAWYWADDARTRLVLVRGQVAARPERWLWHGALLLMTVVCTLGAGAVLQGHLAPPMYHGFSGMVLSFPEFAGFIMSGGWRAILPGWEFAAPLLGILLVHELGHYFVARRYAIDVSPPYFIPVPPNLSPIGGMGAFIRLRSPVYDRRQLLDVGAAGPLAGFVVAFAVLCWGYSLSSRVVVPVSSASSMIFFAGTPIWLGDSLLTRTLRDLLVPGQGPVLLSPEAFAGWVGMFITGLNLLPLSQLDGGHVLYGLLGKGQKVVGITAALGLAVLGLWAPMWYFWAALTFVIGGGRWTHPAVVVPDRSVLRRGRQVGIACIIVFVLTFVAVPFHR